MKYARKMAKIPLFMPNCNASKTTYPGEFLFSSRLDRVIEIIETWRVISTLCDMGSYFLHIQSTKLHSTIMHKIANDAYRTSANQLKPKQALTLYYKFILECIIKKTYGTRPSSMGSHTSVILTELMAVSWCNRDILFCFGETHNESII